MRGMDGGVQECGVRDHDIGYPGMNVINIIIYRISHNSIQFNLILLVIIVII